jgi:tetratricopeptide (TPR) repeat protein
LQTQAELAAVYEQEQKMTEAEALYQKTVATEDKVFGPNSDESAETLLSLAKFYLARGRYEEAEPLYRRLAVRTEKFQGMGVALSPILSGQAVIYSKLGRDAELEAVYKKQIAIYENMFGAQHKAVVKSLIEYASFLRKQKREAEAEPLEARVKSIRGAEAN